jgi:hypothetical protein
MLFVAKRYMYGGLPARQLEQFGKMRDLLIPKPTIRIPFN